MLISIYKPRGESIIQQSDLQTAKMGWVKASELEWIYKAKISLIIARAELKAGI